MTVIEQAETSADANTRAVEALGQTVETALRAVAGEVALRFTALLMNDQWRTVALPDWNEETGAETGTHLENFKRFPQFMRAVSWEDAGLCRIDSATLRAILCRVPSEWTADGNDHSLTLPHLYDRATGWEYTRTLREDARTLHERIRAQVGMPHDFQF